MFFKKKLQFWIQSSHPCLNSRTTRKAIGAKIAIFVDLVFLTAFCNNKMMMKMFQETDSIAVFHLQDLNVSYVILQHFQGWS
jgi:hypothetical protein